MKKSEKTFVLVWAQRVAVANSIFAEESWQDTRMLVRPAGNEDANGIWAIMQPIIRAGETYTLPRDMDKESALAYWLSPEHEVFVAEENREIVGTYFLQANQQGNGGHVANCGYMTAVAATGRGVGRTMCEHSLGRARGRRFRAMQFNFVVSTNERAVRLWQSLEFAIVGRLPKAFLHPKLGYVDAYIMYRDLG
jgi:ribosomal protein S18 acetylase RimI-like enzyme